jgi:hypothetical protein
MSPTKKHREKITADIGSSGSHLMIGRDNVDDAMPVISVPPVNHLCPTHRDLVVVGHARQRASRVQMVKEEIL